MHYRVFILDPAVELSIETNQPIFLWLLVLCSIIPTVTDITLDKSCEFTLWRVIKSNWKRSCDDVRESFGQLYNVFKIPTSNR